jgi:hypothetical protein
MDRQSDMDPSDFERLESRLRAVEKKNRILTALCSLCLVVPAMAIAGWRDQQQDLKVHSLQVMDARGVPMVTLGVTRDSTGGSITLRDATGDRRSWWETGVNTSNLTMSSDAPDRSSDSTVGLSVGPKMAKLGMVSHNGAIASVNLNADSPRIDLWNSKGMLLFGAPWQK